jgi:hypothetical protein
VIRRNVRRSTSRLAKAAALYSIPTSPYRDPELVRLHLPVRDVLGPVVPQIGELILDEETQQVTGTLRLSHQYGPTIEGPDHAAA